MDETGRLPMQMRYPRVLFVTGHAFNHVTGGGITFSNLFRGWPKECIAVVHHDEVPTSTDICDQYYVLGRGEMKLLWPLELLRRLWPRRAAAYSASSPVQKVGGLSSTGWLKRIILGLIGDSMPDRWYMTPALEGWISEFKPDVIYTLLGGNGMMGLLQQIRAHFDIPMVVHLMDDWPSTIYSRGLLARWEKRLMQRQLSRHLHQSVLRLGISDAMCRAFSSRYGADFVPFQNVVDIDRWSGSVRQNAATKGPPYCLLYAGSIFPNAQLQSLIDLCAAVDALNRGGLEVKLQIASPSFLVNQWRHMLVGYEGVEIAAPIEDDEAFYKHISDVDGLVLPVNFDPESVAFIRYSMPTKVPAYLASGTPVLVYGPPGVAQVDYALDRGWGRVVAVRDTKQLQQGIRDLLCNPAEREQLRLTAQAVAAERHDASRARAAFQSLLVGAAGDKGKRA